MPSTNILHISRTWECVCSEHQDLGADHFDRRSTEIKARRLAAQIAKLGYQVELRPLPEAA
jgi:hypothetical protein